MVSLQPDGLSNNGNLYLNFSFLQVVVLKGVFTYHVSQFTGSQLVDNTNQQSTLPSVTDAIHIDNIPCHFVKVPFYVRHVPTMFCFSSIYDCVQWKLCTFFTSVVTMLMGEPFGMPHSIPGPLNWLPLQINDHVCCDFAIWYLVIIGYLLYILDMILLPVFWVWIVVNCHFATFGSWRWTCCQDYFIIFVLLIGIVIILSLWSLSLFASLAW